MKQSKVPGLQNESYLDPEQRITKYCRENKLVLVKETSNFDHKIRLTASRMFQSWQTSWYPEDEAWQVLKEILSDEPPDTTTEYLIERG